MKVLTVLLALIVPPALYFPTLAVQHDKQQERADAELHQLEVRVEQAHAAQRKMPQFLEEKTRLAAELEKLRVILPPKLGGNDILRMLEAATTEKGVRLTRFAPRTPTQSPPLVVGSLEVEIEGSPMVVEAMLRDLTNGPQSGKRLLTVSGVTSAGARTSFVLTAYALPDP